MLKLTEKISLAPAPPEVRPENGLWRWLALSAVILAGFGLRAHAVGQIFLWLDDTEFFNSSLYAKPGQSLIEYSVGMKERTTNTVGWPAAVWISARVFGATPGGARAASVIAGTLAIPSVFFMLYFALRRGGIANAFLPSLLTAALMAASINQIELSQRLYSYGATTLFSALVILAHLNVVHALKATGQKAALNVALLVYAAAGGVALCVSPGLLLAVLISCLVLGGMFLGEIRRSLPEKRLELASLPALAGLVLLFAALMNLKNPRYGYRVYMHDYYHKLDAGAPWFLVKQAYDLLTYNLNLFYDGALYWPQRLNPVLIGLVAVCILGWIAAAKGRFGPLARHLAFLGFLSVCVPAVFSILQIYTFGGDRRSVFLSPYLFGFTAMGFYWIAAIPGVRWIGAVVGVGYLAAWAYGLPAFYRERTMPYTTNDLVTVWKDHGKLPMYVPGGGGNAIRYVLREHPEIQVRDVVAELPEAPYLLVSLHWPIEKDQWDLRHFDRLSEGRFRAALLAERPVKYMASWERPTCLYFPPNGFWVYQINR